MQVRPPALPNYTVIRFRPRFQKAASWAWYYHAGAPTVPHRLGGKPCAVVRATCEGASAPFDPRASFAADEIGKELPIDRPRDVLLQDELQQRLERWIVIGMA